MSNQSFQNTLQRTDRREIYNCSKDLLLKKIKIGFSYFCTEHSSSSKIYYVILVHPLIDAHFGSVATIKYKLSVLIRSQFCVYIIKDDYLKREKKSDIFFSSLH